MRDVLIVGYGEAGKKHYDVLNRHKNFRVVGIADSLPTRKTPSGIQRFSSIHAALLSVKSDLIVIATEPGVSATLVPEAASSGACVLVEKPVATDQEILRELVDDPIKLNQVFVAFQSHFSPAASLLCTRKDLFADNFLRGTVGLTWNRDAGYLRDWRCHRNTSGGILLQHAIHGISLWLRMVPPEDHVAHASCFASCERPHLHTGEDLVFGRVNFYSGRELLVSASINSAGQQSHWLLVEPSINSESILIHGKNLGQKDTSREGSSVMRSEMYDAISLFMDTGKVAASLFPLSCLSQTFRVVEALYNAAS